MSLSKITTVFLIIILLAGNVFLGLKYMDAQKALDQARAGLQAQKTNSKVLDFTKMFIENVLEAKGEVDFETRLKLENTIRDIKDSAILAQWQKFIDSKNELEAQSEVKNLLKLLISKIETQ